MSTILLATSKPFAPNAVEQIRKVTEDAGHQLNLIESYTDKNDLITAINDAEAIIIRSDIIDAEIMDAAANLKIIVRAGAGYDNVDLEAASERNICVMNTPGQNANAVAELVIGFMIFQSRNQFNGTSGTELKGKTIGIVGFGNIGRLVAKAAEGLGMIAMAYDAFISAEEIEKQGVKAAKDLNAIFSESNYVSLHIPAVSDTKGSIDFELLSLMPKKAVLINTARQEVVDELSLVKMLDERPDFRFVSDFMPKEQALYKDDYKGRWFAPVKKMGAQTAEANVNAGVAAAHQIAKFLESGDRTFQVNK